MVELVLVELVNVVVLDVELDEVVVVNVVEFVVVDVVLGTTNVQPIS